MIETCKILYRNLRLALPIALSIFSPPGLRIFSLTDDPLAGANGLHLPVCERPCLSDPFLELFEGV